MHGRYEIWIQNFSRKTWRKPLGSLRHLWEDNSKMRIKEIGCKTVKWIQLAQDRT